MSLFVQLEVMPESYYEYREGTDTRNFSCSIAGIYILKFAMISAASML